MPSVRSRCSKEPISRCQASAGTMLLDFSAPTTLTKMNFYSLSLVWLLAFCSKNRKWMKTQRWLQNYTSRNTDSSSKSTRVSLTSCVTIALGVSQSPWTGCQSPWTGYRLVQARVSITLRFGVLFLCTHSTQNGTKCCHCSRNLSRGRGTEALYFSCKFHLWGPRKGSQDWMKLGGTISLTSGHVCHLGNENK